MIYKIKIMKSILNIFKKRKIMKEKEWEDNINEKFIDDLFLKLGGKISDIECFLSINILELKIFIDTKLIDFKLKNLYDNRIEIYSFFNDPKKADEIFFKICYRKKTIAIEHLNYLRKEKLKSLENK